MVVNKDNLDIELFTKATSLPFRKHKEAVMLFDFIVDNTALLKTGYVLEFGVFQARTINYIADLFKQTVYGFDSFEGLPEAWIKDTTNKTRHPKGHFSVRGLPEVKSNVKLVKGFFDESLPKWIESNDIDRIKLLHVDSDLYTSAKTILTLLNDYIVKDTVIVFDELHSWDGTNGYPNWKEGEWKALVEWVNTYDRKFNIICRTNCEQAAIQVL